MKLLPAAILASALLGGPPTQAGPSPVSQIPENRAPADASRMQGMENPYLVACLVALSQFDFSRGVQFCTLALSVDPHDPDALQLRGYGFLMQHRFEKAEVDLREAVKIRPDNAESLAGLGQALTGLARYTEAVGYFSKAVALEPADAAYRNGLCRARAGTGKDLKIALGDCETAVLLAPGTPGPLNSRGLVELRLGWHALAIEDYTASLALSPSQPSAQFGRGLAQLEVHQTAAGVADILKARSADTGIDAMFIAMGILPRDCSAKAKAKCPAGFPKLEPKRAEGLIARLFSLH